jgi:hypothetical protein
MYKATQEGGAGAGPQQSGAQAGAGATDNVTDAEYEEVKVGFGTIYKSLTAMWVFMYLKRAWVFEKVIYGVQEPQFMMFSWLHAVETSVNGRASLRMKFLQKPYTGMLRFFNIALAATYLSNRQNVPPYHSLSLLYRHLPFALAQRARLLWLRARCIRFPKVKQADSAFARSRVSMAAA